MGFSVGNESSLKNEPNVVPMIDVLLVLLIIFMMIVPASRKTIDIQLPDPNPAPNVAPQQNLDQIVLEVLPGGVYEVNNQAVSGGASGLLARLQDIYNGRPDKIIFVKGAPDVKYQDVIFAMDQARGAGVKVIGIPPGSAEPARLGK
ncbi:MAG TPA: biopolymer transporter ExbD [Gemmatimonadaceae bacterium]|nr:biopolymer transporter ExbD [Gemmatimonadaceae bacterium]